jgi:hypothetical protein
MNTPTTNTDSKRPLRTADLAAVGSTPPAEEKKEPEGRGSGDRLEALFTDEKTARYRSRWAQVQSGFVDDPRRAVAAGDELVADVMKSLAESFAHERQKLESELSHTGEASTETLRVGLRRYRAFFDRLLSL